MSRTDSTPENSPSLGTLLRLAHAVMIEEYTRWLAGSPYKEIQPAHAAAMQPLWQRREGVRLTELAKTARITKQSMGALIDSLEQGGYVERVEDPHDARAWRVRLTASGRQYGRDVRKFAQETERNAANRLGARRLEELRQTLAMFLEKSSERVDA